MSMLHTIGSTYWKKKRGGGGQGEERKQERESSYFQKNRVAWFIDMRDT